MDLVVIPAVDIRGGRCVRLFQGRADVETVFNEDPAAAAIEWERQGAGFLHVVDLDGAFEGRPVNDEAVRKLLSSVSVPVEVGGGIRTLESAAAYLEAGAARVVVGTRALTDGEWLSGLVSSLGDERVVAGLDARSGVVAIEGWTREGDTSVDEALIMLAGAGITRVIHTEVSTDGALGGPDMISLARVIRAAHRSGVKVIASGGVSSSEDVKAVAGIKPRVEGVIIGMALYRGMLTIREAMSAAEVA